jgi:hypothetical protein
MNAGDPNHGPEFDPWYDNEGKLQCSDIKENI